MSRRGECIYKRKDGRWEARFICTYENGKAKYKYIYGKSYNEVKLKRLSAMTSPLSTVKNKSDSIATVTDVAKAWLMYVSPTIKESTLTRYNRQLEKYILPVIGSIVISKTEVQTIRCFIQKLLTNGGMKGNPLSSKSVSDILCVVKSIYKFGSLCGYNCPDLKELKYPQKNTVKIKTISSNLLKHMETILLHSDDSTSLGILICLFTGIRIGELCGLKWGDIDFFNSCIKISRTVERISNLDPHAKTKTKIIISEPKTNTSVRVIPIPQFLKEYLFKLKQANEIYIVSGNEKCTEPHCFYIRYKRYLKRNGIEDNTFHALRHTFATRCIECGFDIKSLSEILGHANVTTTMMFYVHPSMEQKRLQMERLTPAICK